MSDVRAKNTPSFRPQLPARFPWTLDEDWRSGLAQGTNNNQLQLALFYVVKMVDEYDSRLRDLEKELADLKKAKAPVRAPKDVPEA